MSKTYYISTPLYYVNDVPHLGHAYTTMAADSIARYRKMAGDEVFFLTGTDEHGQKLERAARAAGRDPQEYVDRVAQHFVELWERLGIRNDDFIRTTSERHRRGVMAIVERMKAAGDIYEGSYEGLYCTGCEAFYPEAQIEDGVCPDGHDKVERLEEASYFFRLSKYQEPLLRLYDEQPEFIRPQSRRNEVKAFVAGGLKDLSITRTTVSWGIPYPDDPDHVLYVWVDALTNYISALGFGSDDTSRYDRFWPADVHLIGKEIIRFHAVYWPAFLMSAGLPTPKQVFAHGWLLAEEKKMSKSFGNVLDADAYLNVLGRDALRYCLLREVAFGQDGSFSDEAFVDRFNADLANDLGNLVSRATKMIGDWFDGAVPEPAGSSPLEEAARASLERYRSTMERLEFHRALASIWELVSAVNRYVDEKEPWNLRKEEGRRAELGGVLYDCAEAIRWLGVLIAPVMPDTAGKVYAALGLEGDPGESRLDDLSWGGLKAGTRLGAREALFPRLDRTETMKRIAEARKAGSTMAEDKPQTKAEPQPTGEGQGKEPFPEGTPLLSMEDFARLDLRVATVKEADTVEGADKLIRMRIDLGTETRQIVAGVRPHYEPEEMVGKQVILVANLKPATIRGVRSEGMLLAATDGNKVVVAGFDKAVSPGSTVS